MDVHFIKKKDLLRLPSFESTIKQYLKIYDRLFFIEVLKLKMNAIKALSYD